jgi:molybdopterin/thiamine biosynthesis adenylyltransferase
MTEGFAVIEEQRTELHLLSPEALATLRSEVVAVVGVGTLGGAILPHFAMVGVSALVVDHDSVEARNLANQHFSAVTDLGEPKAAVRARQARALNPELAIEALSARVEELGFARLAGASLIVSTVDSFTSRVRLNEIAVRLGIPLLDLAVDGSGERELGLVTVYDPARGGPCLLCSTSQRELAARLHAEQPRHCPSFRDAAGQAITAATLAGSGHAAVVTGFAAQWALRLLLGQGDRLIGSRLVVSGGAAPRVETVKLARNAACLHDHRAYEIRARLAEARVGEALAAASRLLGGEATSVRFAARSLVVGLGCECGAELPIVGVIGSSPLRDARCERCGSRELQPQSVTDTLAGASLDVVRERTWQDLGVPSADLVNFSSGDASAWCAVACDGGKEA